MELFRLEHKKLWGRKSVQISFYLCLFYVILAGILTFQGFGFGSSNHGVGVFQNNWDGKAIIEQSQAHTQRWNGELTDESVQEMVADYQQISAAAIEPGSDVTDWQMVNLWLQTLWPDLQDPSATYPNLMIGYVDPKEITGLYERRQQAVTDFLDLNNQLGAEREYLLKMDEKIKIPFSYGWVRGWSTLLTDTLPELGILITLVLTAALSALFSGEWHSNTNALILTTKNGWQQTAKAKIGAGLAFTLELVLSLTAGYTALQILYLGTQGWNIPIQCIKLTAIAPMNMLQAEIYEYLFTLLGAVGFAGIVMLISSRLKSSFISLLLSLSVIYLPEAIVSFLPFSLQKALDLLPLSSGGATDIFRTNTFSVFGRIIWSPYLLLTVPVLIGLACVPLTIRGWSRRHKK